MRLTVPASAWVGLAAIHLHFSHLFHHRFHGPPFDYVGLAIGAVVSSAGFPGPGEALLIAGGIVAASGRLDITSVITVAFVGATFGGVVGWYIGLKAGRTVLSAPGPLRRARLRALTRGDRVFHRQVAIAVILAPAWVAGIHHVRSRIYQPLNAVSAALWAVGVGLGAYYVGASVTDALADLGIASLAILGAFVLGVVGFELRRRRGQRRGGGDDLPERHPPPPGDGGIPSDQAPRSIPQ